MDKWLSLIQVLAPIVLTLVKPQLAPIVKHITDGIQEAEKLFSNSSGPNKLVHVQNIAADAADAVNEAAGKTVVDKVNLDQTVKAAVDTTISVVNLVNQKSK